ncbi:thiopeptide-type bacteriocin biosynthesis protein [Streptomyces niveus]|uniref:thiopeptide-type bacteriocin biosynthesis protein n=1 Tax=Streptomyces niveus TaxID=193462 RepID=UPI0035D60AB3
MVRHAVLAVLTGLPLTDAARRYRMGPVVLSDAVAVYDQAGREALVRHAATTDWWQTYLHFTDWSNADSTFATHVLPILREAEAADAIDGWWYTRKHPCWRLRLWIQPVNGAKLTIEDDFDRLVSEGHLQRWWPGIMMRAARLEWYEQGDVWDRVITTEHRSAVSDVPPEQLDARVQEIRPLLLADSDTLLRPGGGRWNPPLSGWPHSAAPAKPSLTASRTEHSTEGCDRCSATT